MEKQLTEEQKNWMLKAILNSTDLIIFQHEEEALSTMYWKYTKRSTITEDELSDDIKYLDNLAN